LGWGFSAAAIGGYQILPEDSSTANDVAPMTTVWPEARGWNAGGGMFFGRPAFDQNLVVTYGRGDVEMAWGAPDWVYRYHSPTERDRLLREGSSLTQAVYWGSILGRRLALTGGVWGQWRRPAWQQRDWVVFSDATGEARMVRATTQDFRALKGSLTPMAHFRLLTVGVRFDGVRYLDKKATTNTIEPLTDEALRPLFEPAPPGTTPDRMQGPSLWEREAADAAVVSPFVELMVGSVFRIRATWSGAWYSHAVRRQRRVSTFHGNLTLSAWLIYRFSVDDRDADSKEHIEPAAVP
jgi:hypothetical protein